ncbi:GNAT family N-acetyltransferase [Candidatus Thiodiazotropha sp. CDECU1]|uniref:GNAT family N-acetyltransferase n=1 Tax=Candidatus Thiodiazotropha sp. CDECU1 TaxID=3065865 RepID=UPI00292E813D|nr:N-acetyltransferase [Candidatus Thiodiazotropha sp. CDECU1]
MKLTPYDKSDEVEIKQLFTEVFSDAEGEPEGVLIGNLVADLINTTEPDDIFGFVVTEQEQIIGSIFFTRLIFDTPVEAFILSPVAIRTNQQGKGVGQQLINYGIEQMRDMGVKLLFTYGDPNFYSKVGFRSITEEIVKAPLELTQPEGWLCQSLDGGETAPIAGKSTCVTALNKPEYW